MATRRLLRRKLGIALCVLVAAGWATQPLAHDGGILADLWHDFVRALRTGGDPNAKQQPGSPKPYFGKLPSMAAINIRDAVLTEITSGLNYPWAMEFVNDNEILVTQFHGEIVRINLKNGNTTQLTGLPAMPEPRNQIGLLDLALHPRHAENGLIFFSHAVEKSGPDKTPSYATAVTRARLDGNNLTELKRILVAEPYGTSTSNFGGALAFDNDGWLYVTTGDRSSRHHPQHLNTLPGKVLRIDIEGEPAPDNPFVGHANADPRIFAYGVRNPQGLEFDPEGGGLFETEHGPMGGDEVNYILPGRNYGWPVITYGANYTFKEIGGGTALAQMEQPLYYYLPSIAVSPITRYTGSMFPEWEGDLLVGALRAEHINKLDMVNGYVRSEQRILTELGDRVRDIKVDTDGAVYFLLQDSGAVVRLHRDRTAAAEGLETKGVRTGRDVYETICASCHDTNAPGMPQGNDTAEWSRRLAKGKRELYKNAIEGVGSMPPMGFCASCSEKEIRAAVNYILKRSRATVQ